MKENGARTRWRGATLPIPPIPAWTAATAVTEFRASRQPYLLLLLPHPPPPRLPFSLLYSKPTLLTVLGDDYID